MNEITHIPTLEPRAADAHKGTFGKVLIIAGSRGMTGAAAIAGTAALRSGAGLVRIACPESTWNVIASICPCYTTLPLPEDEHGQLASDAAGVLTEQLDQNDAFAFGPGLGTASGVRDCLRKLLRHNIRLIIDADGLNCLAAMPGWTDNVNASLILTPHPGEFARLWKSLFREKMPRTRRDQAAQLAQKTRAVVVLKGAGTVVTDGENLYTNATGNPGMATGGTGDVLTGMITALAGQRLSSMDAAVLGTYIHGLAGDRAAETKGRTALIASDLLDALPGAWQTATGD